MKHRNLLIAIILLGIFTFVSCDNPFVPKPDTRKEFNKEDKNLIILVLNGDLNGKQR